MKTVIDAVNELKGDYNCKAELAPCDQIIVAMSNFGRYSVGDIDVGSDQKYNAKSHWRAICTLAEFNSVVAECETNFGKCNPIHYKLADKVLLTKNLDKELDMEKLIDTNLDWSKDDEYIVCTKANSITKCWTIGDKYKIKQSLKGDFVVDDLGRNRYKGDLAGANFTLQDKPTPIFTQEMVDNGVFPGVGHSFIVGNEVESDSRTIDFKGLEVEVIGLSKLDDDTVITFSHPTMGIGCGVYFKSWVKPLTPPVPLIDGKAYQFDYDGGIIAGVFSKGYVETYADIAKNNRNDLFVCVAENLLVNKVTNIQPLTVEVK